MGYISNADKVGVGVNDGDGTQNLNDTSLIFLFQNKIFNAILEEDTQKALQGVFLLDAHMEPYKKRWKDKEVEKKGADGVPVKVVRPGYKKRVAAMKEKYCQMTLSGVQTVEIGGRAQFLPVKADEIDFQKTIEWYRLLRVLMEKANLLPARWISIDY